MRSVFMIGSAIVVLMFVVLSALAGAVVSEYGPQESYVHVHNSIGDDINDLWIADDDVTDHNKIRDDVPNHLTTHGDVNDRHLKCWSGIVSRVMRRLKKKDCNGSCTTALFGKGVIFDCADAFEIKGCRRVHGSIKCFCNEPLCNNGTLPNSFLGSVDVNQNHGADVSEYGLQKSYVNVHNSVGDGINDLWTTGDDVTDHIPTRYDVTNHFTTHGDVNDRHLKCWSGYVGQGMRRLHERECNGSCATVLFGKGVIFDCAVAFTTRGCRRVRGSMSCFCNEPLCNDGADVSEYNLKERYVNVRNSEGNDINDLWIADNDVTDHDPTIDDIKNYYATHVNNRHLKCWSGYVGQGMRRLKEKECNGSCATVLFGKGVIFDCAVAFTTKGCRRVQGSLSCFCNEPLCNDGTLPSSFLRFIGVNLKQSSKVTNSVLTPTMQDYPKEG